jgi:xanthine phosphoribosyltransferase
MDRYFYSYEQFVEDTKILSQQIKPYNPDALITITRGGMTLTHFLANLLDIRKIYCINSVGYNNETKNSNTIICNIPQLDNDISKVVIVDDILDSGETIKNVLEILQNKYPTIKFQVAVIFYKDTAISKANYKLHKTTKWIEFFWEKF